MIDCVARAQHFTSIAGDGVITNLHKNGITVTLLRSGETFSGRVYGKFNVEPIKDITPQGAYMVIGNKETLADADFSITDVEGCDIEVKFAPGIGRFFAKSFPTDRKFYDTEGKEVVLVKGRDWFVDCSRTVSGDGKTPETAFRTLQEAMENEALNAGNTVYVLPGIYSEGEMKTSATSKEKNRVIVKAGVSLVSTAGSEQTFICGAKSPTPVKADCGEDAIRCVLLNEGSHIRGFTVTNGHTYCVEADKGAYYGGGISGGVNGDATDECHVEDCVITGCSAVRGGGVCHVTCIRCRLEKNEVTYLGSASSEAAFYNCTFSGHATGTYAAMYSPAVNCTFLADNTVLATWSQKNSTDILCKNCVFLCQAGRDQLNFQNCLFLTTSGIADDNIGQGSMKKAASETGIKTDGRPRKGSCVVDAGDNALYPSDVAGGLDVQGSQRIYNETIDIGAYEWKPSDKGLMLLFR